MWCGRQASFPSGCAGGCHLDNGRGWCWRIYSLCWVWVGTSSLQMHSLQLPCHGRVCSQVAEAEALRLGSIWLFDFWVFFLLPHWGICCKGGECWSQWACVLTEFTCVACVAVWGSAQTWPECMSFHPCGCPSFNARLHGVGRVRVFPGLGVGIVICWRGFAWLCCYQRSGLLLGCCLIKCQWWPLPFHLDHRPGSEVAGQNCPPVSGFPRSRAKLRCEVNGVGVFRHFGLGRMTRCQPLGRTSLHLVCW